MKKLCIFLIGFFVAGSSAMSGCAKESEISIKFGLIKEDAAGSDYVYEETTTIPFITRSDNRNFHFGYSMEHTEGRPVKFQEIIYAPSKPRTVRLYGFADDIDGNTFRGKIQETPKVTAAYGFDEGDPLGEWRIEFYVNEHLFQAIRFDVIPKENMD